MDPIFRRQLIDRPFPTERFQDHLRLKLSTGLPPRHRHRFGLPNSPPPNLWGGPVFGVHYKVRYRIAELLSLIESTDSSSSNPAVMAAFISRRGAILAAIIAAIAAIVVGLMANWEKISSRGTYSVAPPATP